MHARIASLVPSVTELLVALGLAPWLVARTGFCIHPADALAAVPKVGGTKDVNLAKLRALAPTHAIVNVDENRLETFEALRAFVPALIVTHPCGPQDVTALIAQMTAAFGSLGDVAARAQAMRMQLQEALDEPATVRTGTALVLVWRDPWMAVARDTYIARLLAHAGWTTVPATDGGQSGAARYPRVAGDEPWLAEVRDILLTSEPYAFGPADIADAQRLAPAARVRLVDGELLSWYGPRTAAGLRYARALAAA